MSPRIGRTVLGLASLVAAGLTVGFAGPAWADPPQDPHAIYTFQVENDAVSTLSGTSDQYYTSGLRLGYTSGTDGVPSWLASVGQAVWGDGVQRIAIDLSQSLFTPRDTQLVVPNPKDRPYAAYLSLNGSLIHDSDTARSVLMASVGVIGPSALGEEVQNGFHNIIGDTPNRGWHYQLQDEPAFEFLGEKTLRVPLTHVGNLEVDALPELTAGVGTVRDYVQAGFSFRLGQGLDSDFGAPRIRPGLSGGDAYTPTQPFVWYVFAGADGQAIARDVFLDGSTFRNNSPHVTKIPFLGEMEAGLGLMLYGVRLTYTQTWQTQSFEGQKGGLFSFGSFAASVRF
jgi:hypothetical protein